MSEILAESTRWARARTVAKREAEKARQRAGGDHVTARRMLWRRGRRNRALREALFRVGCDLLFR